MKLNTVKAVLKRPYMAWVAIFISGILFTMGIQIFVSNAHLFLAGVGSISSIPAYLVEDLRDYITIFYLAINIPLIIAFWKKTKKRFMYKTIFFLVSQAAFGALFIIPEVHDVFANLIIDSSKIYDKIWPIFIFALFGGLLNGFAVALAWKFGGSTAGADIIVYYFSTHRKKNIGNISFIASSVFATISFIITISVKEDIRDHAVSIVIGTIIYISVTTFMINYKYPKYSKINVEINSSKDKEIVKFLKKHYSHSFHIFHSKSGYTGKDQVTIKTVMLVLEYKDFATEMLRIDPNVWMKAERVISQIGKFNTNAVEME